jgi:3-oxoacyl-[acyl-carrier-protein] synthase-3
LKALVTGTGIYVPERIVSNEEIAERLGLTPEQIFKSSGIHRRRWADAGTRTSQLAAHALRNALEDARLEANDVDYLILGTMTPDRFIPGSSPSVQNQLGLRQIPCLDIRATCCNALYGMQLARALVQSRAARHVAICLAEIQSAWLDLSPASGTISMLFGDGASALIVSAEDSLDEDEDKDERRALEILDVLLATDGAYVDDLGIRCPGTEFGVSSARGVEAASAGASVTEASETEANIKEASAGDTYARMVGQSVILQASRKMVTACNALLARNNLAVEDVQWVVPHQANANLLAQVGRALRFPPEWNGLISVLEDFGNTSSASLGLALDSLRRSGRIGEGDYLLLPAFGAGFTWGAGLCRA